MSSTNLPQAWLLSARSLPCCSLSSRAWPCVRALRLSQMRGAAKQALAGSSVNSDGSGSV